MRALFLWVCATVLLTGCTAPTAAPQPGASTHPATLWWQLDSAGNRSANLPADHPDVLAIRDLITRHAAAVDNRDHVTVAERAADEDAFYVPAMSQALAAQDYRRKLVALYTGSHLRTRHVRISWYESTLSADLATARVEVDITLQFDAADAAYLAANKLQLATPYLQHRTLDLVKNDGRWLISRIDKMPLTRGTPSA